MGNKISKKERDLDQKEKELCSIEAQLYLKYEQIESMVHELEKRSDELRMKEFNIHLQETKLKSMINMEIIGTDFIPNSEDIIRNIENIKYRNNKFKNEKRRMSIC